MPFHDRPDQMPRSRSARYGKNVTHVVTLDCVLDFVKISVQSVLFSWPAQMAQSRLEPCSRFIRQLCLWPNCYFTTAKPLYRSLTTQYKFLIYSFGWSILFEFLKVLFYQLGRYFEMDVLNANSASGDKDSGFILAFYDRYSFVDSVFVALICWDTQ